MLRTSKPPMNAFESPIGVISEDNEDTGFASFNIFDSPMVRRSSLGLSMDNLASFENSAPKLQFPELKNRYKIIEKIGEGTFSVVYKAQNLEKPNDFVAIKRIYPSCSPSRTLRELQFLVTVNGHPNIAPLLNVVRCQDQISFVMFYFEHKKFRDYLPILTKSQVRFYMKSLFQSLQCVHAQGIIHRDIKPGNFLYDPDRSAAMLVDFGLAQKKVGQNIPDDLVADSPLAASLKRKRAENLMQKKTPSSTGAPSTPIVPNAVSTNPSVPNHALKAPRQGTRGFRAPEVLFRVVKQGFEIDIWSAGVIFLCLLSTRYPFFLSPDDLTSLVELSAVFGTKQLTELGISLNRRVVFPQEYPPQDLKELCNRLSTREYQMPESAFDLLRKCLELSASSRITAEQALQHPFFTEHDGE